MEDHSTEEEFNIEHQWNMATKVALEAPIQASTTFIAHTILNHLESEVEFEIGRTETRINSELSAAAKFFRSTYPKYLVWMYLVRATLRQKAVSVSQVACASGLTRSGIRSILDSAYAAGYAHKMKVGNVNHFVASNISMEAYVDRACVDANQMSADRLVNLKAFRALQRYFIKTRGDNSENWFLHK